MKAWQTYVLCNWFTAIIMIPFFIFSVFVVPLWLAFVTCLVITCAFCGYNYMLYRIMR